MKLWQPALAATLALSPLYADFTYQETTRITGGAMVSMMKFAGAFSKDARKATDPIQSTVSIKGNRMARKTQDALTVTDLDQETITQVNYAKRTYTVMTFAQMKQMMDQMSQRMAQGSKAQPASKPQDTDVQFDMKVNDTGNTKSIGGNMAHEFIVTLTMQGTDNQSGAKGGIEMTTEMWRAQKVAGYDEVLDFYKRMAEKMAWSPVANPAMMSRPGMSAAVARMSKESAKMEGIPILEVTRMNGSMTGMPPQDASAQQQPEQNAPPPTSVSGALGGMLAGRMAKRKQDNASSSDSGSAGGSLMESTKEVTGFSSAPADPALFEVPSGFTKVEQDMMNPGRGKR
jgi:hypothetical protein